MGNEEDRPYKPDPLFEAREEIARLRTALYEAKEEIRRLRAAVHGDPQEGFPGVRGRVEKLEQDIRDLEDEIELRLNKITDRLDEAERQRSIMSSRLALASGVLKWLGPTGVVLIAGFILYVIRNAPA